MRPSPRSSLIALVLLVPLTGCGAGYVAIFGGGSGSGPTPLLKPSVGGFAPLFPTPDTTAKVSVENYDLPDDLSRIRVELRAFDGIVDPQRLLRLPEADEVDYLLITTAIRDHVTEIGGPTAVQERDVQAEMVVLVDGVQIAPPAPILLLRQPRAVLDNRPARVDLSPLGQVVDVRLSSVSSPLLSSSARVAFGSTLDEQREVPLQVVGVQPNGDLLVRVTMPAVDHAIQAHVVVDTMPSGRSTLVSNLYYRPAISVTSPTTGATEGGTTVAVFGKAMVALNHGSPPELDFDRVTLTLRKGGRQTVVEPSRIRREFSTADRIEFKMPPAPDGRPGPVDINVKVNIDLLGGLTLDVQTTAPGVFTYGDSSPYFGPRGVLVRDRPAAVNFARFVDTGQTIADALSVASGPGGMPYVTVLRTRGNGLFTRFGQRLQAGLSSDQLQRNPVDLCIADFIGDGTRSGLILNAGNSGFARYGLVLGSKSSNPPISFDENFRLEVERSGLSCASGDFNHDGIEDLVVLSQPLPSDLSAPPIVFLSHGTPQKPEFRRMEFSTYTGNFFFTAMDVADLDGDGEYDLIFANGEARPRLLVAFGSSTGIFAGSEVVDLEGASFDLATAGYTPDAGSTVRGVHVLPGPGKPSVALVFSGVAASATSPPAVVHVRQGTSRRTFDKVAAGDVHKFAGGNRVFTHSAAGDLTGDGRAELAVAADADATDPLRLFSQDASGRLAVVNGAVDLGVGRVSSVVDLGIGLAAAAGTHHQAAARRALFVTHTQSLTAGDEHRVSAFLAAAGPGPLRVVSPLAARNIDSPILGVSLGSFFAKRTASPGVAMDVWLARAEGLLSLENDGLGELQPAPASIVAPGILPTTLATVRAGATAVPGSLRSMPAVLTEDGRLAVVLPSDRTKLVFAGGSSPVDLRQVASEGLRLRKVRPNSAVMSADVDQDGFEDLVVMVGLARGAGPDDGLEGESLLLLLRGKAAPAADEFPYEVPDPEKPLDSVTHGNVSSFAVGDFVTTGQSNLLELAVALPTGGSLGSEVRFYRWDGQQGVFVHSFASQNHHVLPVGNEPVCIAAGDYNSDGRTDIAVASREDDNLWVFNNFSAPGTTVEVDVQAFQSAPANPLPLPPGTPRTMLSADVSGDAAPDVVVLVDTGTTTREQHVVYYLGPGLLSGSGIRAIPHERTGNYIRVGPSWQPRDAAAAMAMGDLNGDGAPDLILGWDTSGPRDYNLRVLFGNNF